MPFQISYSIFNPISNRIAWVTVNTILIHLLYKLDKAQFPPFFAFSLTGMN
jgi:hypothetical protein